VSPLLLLFNKRGDYYINFLHKKGDIKIMNYRYNIHPALYIGGFAVLFSFIFGFPVGTLIGLAIGIGISKKNKDM
jgi:hypothetical protein